MTVKGKLKTISKSESKAGKRLIELVTKDAGKKKILKKVAEIQTLEKKKKKLEKQAKADKKRIKDRGPKAKGKSKKKAKPEKVTKKKPSKPKVRAELNKALLQHIGGKVASNNNQRDHGKGRGETSATKAAASRMDSLSYNAKDAIRTLGDLQSVNAVQTFIASEARKTVIERAESRIRAIESEQ